MPAPGTFLATYMPAITPSARKSHKREPRPPVLAAQRERRRVGDGDHHLRSEPQHHDGLVERHLGRTKSRTRPSTAWPAAQPRRWSLTRPIASMKEYTVVGPTNAQPRLRRSLLMASASGLNFTRISSSRVINRRRGGGAKRHA